MIQDAGGIVKKMTIRELLHWTDPYIKKVCQNIIFIILFLLITIFLCYLGNRANGSESLIYIVILYFPPITVWIIKSLKNSGNSWSGGLISGHSAYAVAVALSTDNALPEIPKLIILLLVILPMLFVIKSRFTNNSTPIAIGGLILGVLFQFIIISLLCVYQKNWSLILANTILLLLTIESYFVDNVHQKTEVIWGMALGLISTVLFFFLFKAW